MRVGMGYDVHPLIAGETLVLGGVFIPYHFGLSGHSDADVLVHAIMDALLGAAALGDIGQHFPPNEEEWRDIKSLILLRRVKELLDQEGMVVGNLDTVIVAQEPRLAPYIPAMQKNISETLGLVENQVSIKATTTEGLGFCGREEGIAVMAVSLMEKKEDDRIVYT